MINQGIAFLLKGGWVMWPLFLLAVISVAVMLERSIVIGRIRTDNEDLMKDIEGHLDAGHVKEAIAACEKTPGPVAVLLANGLRNSHLDNIHIERAMEELALRQTPPLQKRLGILDTIITMSPLIGLLGTITGMIRTFNVVAGPSNSNAAGEITGGVAEALIATATGLAIAIATLPVYNFLSERVREVISEMETRATQLLNMLASQQEKKAGKGDKA